MRRGLYTHTITLFVALGEVARRRSWTAVVLDGVRVDTSRGTIQALGGPQCDDRAALFIPSDRLGSYVIPEDFDGLAGWTLRDGDMFVVGTCDDASPPASAYRVTHVDPFTRFGDSIHHLEVLAR